MRIADFASSTPKVDADIAAARVMRIVLARARQVIRSGDGDPHTNALAAATAVALGALGWPDRVEAIADDAGWSNSAEVYDEASIFAALLRLAGACAERGQLHAAGCLLTWLRGSVEETTMVDLLWRLIQIQAGRESANEAGAAGSAADFERLLSALGGYPGNPRGALAELRRLGEQTRDGEVRGWAGRLHDLLSAELGVVVLAAPRAGQLR